VWAFSNGQLGLVADFFQIQVQMPKKMRSAAHRNTLQLSCGLLSDSDANAKVNELSFFL